MSAPYASGAKRLRTRQLIIDVTRCYVAQRARSPCAILSLYAVGSAARYAFLISMPAAMAARELRRPAVAGVNASAR